MYAFFHEFGYIIFCGQLWKIASVGRESSKKENGKLWKINVPTGGQQHTFSRRGIGLCASGDHVNGVENLIDFGNRPNFPRRSFFARRRGRERAVGGDNATHYDAQKMNGVENLGRFEQSKFSRIVHCAISEIWTIVENLIAPRGNLHTVPPASSAESAEGIFLWNGVEN